MSEPEVTMKAEDGNFLHFFYDTSENKHSTALAGRPIFDQALKVRVTVPGDTKSENVFEVEREFSEVRDGDSVVKGANLRVNERIMQQYGREIRSFKEQGGDAGDMRGTPIDQWNMISRRQAAELKAMHIHTVETLAELGDAGITSIGMGGRKLVEQAKAYLEEAQGGSGISRLAHENEELKSKVKEQDQTIRELAERLDALETKPKRGRPKKEEVAA